MRETQEKQLFIFQEEYLSVVWRLSVATLHFIT